MNAILREALVHGARVGWRSMVRELLALALGIAIGAAWFAP